MVCFITRAARYPIALFKTATKKMFVDDLFYNAALQNAILADAATDARNLDKQPLALIGDSRALLSSKPASLRPMTLSQLQCSERLRTLPENPRCVADDLGSFGDAAEWERQWMVLTLLYVSPSILSALSECDDAIQQLWLYGSCGNGNCPFVFPEFRERYARAVCHRVVTPLEFVIDEELLWRRLSGRLMHVDNDDERGVVR